MVPNRRSSPKSEAKSLSPVIVPKRVKVDPPKTGRSTRRSAAAAAVAQNDEAESARSKRTRHSESSAESLTKDFPLKTCSVKLKDAVKSPEKASKSPETPTRQVAMKSTNQRQEVAEKSLNSPEGADKKTTASSNQRKGAAQKFASSSEADSKKTEETELKVKTPKPSVIFYKSIANIAYTKCRSGVIRRCLVTNCGYQSLER